MEVSVLAYIAGIVDGEGSIMIQRQCSKAFMEQRAKSGCFHPHYAVGIRIGMLERIALDLIVDELKIGKVCQEKPYHHKRPMYRWMIRSKDEVIKFLNLILPYLRVKKKQAQLAIKFMDEWVSCNGRKLTPEIISKRQRAWREMRKLNGVIDTPATTKSRGIRGREKSAPYEAIV